MMCLGTVSNSIIIIGYYHGLLLRDIDADLLVGEMLSAELVNVHEHNLILSGHSLHHRNRLLLDHVRHLNSQSLQVFIELVQDVWPEIGLQMITGNYSCMLEITYNVALYDLFISPTCYFPCVYFDRLKVC